jgi:hypothetical protein
MNAAIAKLHLETFGLRVEILVLELRLWLVQLK